MNLLALLPEVLKVVGKVTGLSVFGNASTALTGLQLPPEKQVELQEAVLVHEQQMKALSIEEMKTAMSEGLAMIASPDKYVARARPTGLYIFYLVSAAIAIGMLFGVKIDPTAVLTILGPLAGVGGTYVYQRSQEKIANGK